MVFPIVPKFTFNPRSDYSRWSVICYVRASVDEGQEGAERRLQKLVARCESLQMQVIEQRFDVIDDSGGMGAELLRISLDQPPGRVDSGRFIRLITDAVECIEGTSSRVPNIMVVPDSLPKKDEREPLHVVIYRWNLESGRPSGLWPEATEWIESNVARLLDVVVDEVQQQQPPPLVYRDSVVVEEDPREGFRRVLAGIRNGLYDVVLTPSGLFYDSFWSERYLAVLEAGYGIQVVTLPIHGKPSPIEDLDF